MVEFITEGLNRGGNYPNGGRWSSFPLYFNVSYDEENIGTFIDIDASIVIEELPVDSGNRFIRRNQSHVFLNNRRAPEFKAKVTNGEYRCLLAWHIVSYTYTQGQQIPYTISNEREAYSGRHRGKGIWEKWFDEDKIYKNETINLRFLRKDNRGEPAEFELIKLIEEKQRRYNEYYRRWSRGETARRVAFDEENRFSTVGIGRPKPKFTPGTFKLEDYVRNINSWVDLRSWRPLTMEKIYRMSDADIFSFQGNTETVERVVLSMMSRMLEPRDRDDFGITKANGVLFSLVPRLPRPEEKDQGKGLFRNTINRIRGNIKEEILLQPYGELAGKTI